MTKTVSINEVKDSIQVVIDLTKNGDEIVIEENGKPIVKITPLAKPERKERVLGLGNGDYYMSKDFDDELPDEFWDFDNGNNKIDKIAEIFADEKQITETLQQAIHEAIEMYKRAGNSIAVWRNGKAVWIETK